MKRLLIILNLIFIPLTIFSDESLQLYEAGKKAFSVGLYSIALENFEQYLNTGEGEKHLESLYLSGISSYYLKKYSKSISYLTGIEKEYFTSVYYKKSLYWLALNNYYLGKYSESRDLFKKNIDIGKDYLDISLLFHGLASLQLGDDVSGIESFKRVIEDNSFNQRYRVEAIYRLGTLYLEKKEFNNALITLYKIVYDYPSSKYYNDSIRIVADIYFVLEEWENALRFYEQILDTNIDSRSVIKRLATIYTKIGEKEKSADYLSRYLREFGPDLDVVLNLADIYSVSSRPYDAIELYKTANLNSEVSAGQIEENLFRIGNLYYNNKDYKNAYINFSMVDRKESLYLTVLSGIQSGGEVLSYIKKLNNRYYDTDFARDSINRYVNFLQDKGDMELIEEFLLYITDLYPENIEYSLTYGEFLLVHNRLDDSIKYLSKGYVNNSGYYSNIVYKLGWIYYQKEEYARSIEYFDKISLADSEYTKALYSKSMANYKLGNYIEGKQGFLNLLNLDTPYNSEINFFLGLIEKNNYNYQLAMEYFSESQSDSKLHFDSLENIAWCYYYLKDYINALDIYTQLWELEPDITYKFNIGNCYYYLMEYEKALKSYNEVTRVSGKMQNSAFYKSVEILFLLERDEEGYAKVMEYIKTFPDSELPGELLISLADNNFNNNKIDKAIVNYLKIIDIFKKNKFGLKARFKLAQCYSLKGDYKASLEYYIGSIKDRDIYFDQSVSEVVVLLSEIENPEFTFNAKEFIESENIDKSTIIPIYIEFIKQGIYKEDTQNNIEKLIEISKSREEIDWLIYYKSLFFFQNNFVDQSQQSLAPLLIRPEVGDRVKINATMLQCEIYTVLNRNQDAVDLYLKLYITYNKYKDESAYALYKALLLSKNFEDRTLYSKILKILKDEFSDTTWGMRIIDEK